MPVDPMRALFQSLGHAARSERKKVNKGGATGWGLIGFGISTLPVPISSISAIII
jgi:hypothetical protein